MHHRRILTAALLATVLGAAEPAAIPLTGIWSVARTAPIMTVADGKQAPDPGISPIALAVVAGRLEGLRIESRQLPATWDAWGGDWRQVDGEVTFWRTVQVPDPGTGAWELCLGSIDDVDTTWINGTQVGSTDQTTPGYWARPRRYLIPAGVLKTGENRIVVRVFDQGGLGGFNGSPESLQLRPAPP